MTVQHVRTATTQRAAVRPAPARADARVTARSKSDTGAERGPLCLVVPEIADGEGVNLVRSLRRRESTRAVLLTRRAGRRELVVLLGGGVRGAVASEPPGAVRIAARPPQDQPPAPELSAREISVLRLVAEGRTNREIGEELELSGLTVKSHLSRISRRIGIGDRAEMVAFAIRRNLLT